MRQIVTIAVVLALPLLVAACDQPCAEEEVCEALEGALDERAADCGSAAITTWPDEPAALGPGSGIICDSAWNCVQKLDEDLVPCDDLGSLSLARCDLY